MANKLNGQGLPVCHTEPSIKIEISKMTALRDTLVYNSENGSTFCFVLFIGVFYVCVRSNC